MSLPRRKARYSAEGLQGRDDLLWKQFSAELKKARVAAGNKIGAEIRNKQRAAVRARLKAAGIDPDKRLNHRNKDEKALVSTKRRLSRTSGASQRRLAGIRFVVAKSTGMLVMLDHAPLAEAQEEGKTITASGGLLSIGRAGKSLGKPGTRIPGAFTFRSKSGNLLLVRKVGKGKDSKLEHLATMMRSIRIKKSLGFYERIEAALPKYMEEVEKKLIEGFK